MKMVDNGRLLMIVPPSSVSGDNVGWLPRRRAGGIDSSMAADCRINLDNLFGDTSFPFW